MGSDYCRVLRFKLISIEATLLSAAKYAIGLCTCIINHLQQYRQITPHHELPNCTLLGRTQAVKVQAQISVEAMSPHEDPASADRTLLRSV